MIVVPTEAILEVMTTLVGDAVPNSDPMFLSGLPRKSSILRPVFADESKLFAAAPSEAYEVVTVFCPFGMIEIPRISVLKVP
jgi:hypothetical protein